MTVTHFKQSIHRAVTRTSGTLHGPLFIGFSLRYEQLCMHLFSRCRESGASLTLSVSRLTFRQSSTVMKSQLSKPVGVSSNHCSAKICILSVHSAICQVGPEPPQRGSACIDCRSELLIMSYWLVL